VPLSAFNAPTPDAAWRPFVFLPAPGTLTRAQQARIDGWGFRVGLPLCSVLQRLEQLPQWADLANRGCALALAVPKLRADEPSRWGEGLVKHGLSPAVLTRLTVLFGVDLWRAALTGYKLGAPFADPDNLRVCALLDVIASSFGAAWQDMNPARRGVARV
jgi:hypothetical protein